jgi:hypothetical protein
MIEVVPQGSKSLGCPILEERPAARTTAPNEKGEEFIASNSDRGIPPVNRPMAAIAAECQGLL